MQAGKQFNAKSQELQDKERMCELTHAANQSDVTYAERLGIALHRVDTHFLDEEGGVPLQARR